MYLCRMPRQFTRAEKTLSATFDDIPRRIFLDSSALQALQSYGGFIYENAALDAAARIHRDPTGVDKLTALRCIMEVAQRAPFKFALSHNSFLEVTRRGDTRYLFTVGLPTYWTTGARALKRLPRLLLTSRSQQRPTRARTTISAPVTEP
jgi:hypothetical protein